MRKFIIIAFSLSLFIASCGDIRTRTLLHDVETYIQERPDSALHVLRNVDSSSLSTKKLCARYSLLFAMALDKNYVDTTALTVLSPAVTFYEKEGSRYEKMLTYYYLGRIYSNMKDYPNAVIYYSMALDESSDDDYYHRGLAYGALADAFNATYNDEEELRNARLAYMCFEKFGDKSQLILSRFKLAQASHNSSLFDLADSIYSSVYSGSDSTSHLALLAMIDQVSNDIQRQIPDVQRDLALLEYVSGHGGNLSLTSYYEYAYLLLLDGNVEAAQNILFQLPECDTDLETFGIRYRIAEFEGKDKKALALLDRSLSHQNAVVKEQLAQSVFKAKSDHYHLKAELYGRQAVIANLRSVIIFIVCLLAIVLALSLFRKRKNALLREKDRLAQAVEESVRLLEEVRVSFSEEKNERDRDIIGLRRSNENQLLKLHELRKMYVRLYQRQFIEIGKYYDASFSHRTESISEKAGQNVLTSTMSLLDEISGRSEGQQKFEIRINADLDGIISKIRTDFPKLKDDDIRFVCYMIVGFDTSAISFLMDMSKENVRVKKHRLREKLNSYSGPNEDLYRMFT